MKALFWVHLPGAYPNVSRPVLAVDVAHGMLLTIDDAGCVVPVVTDDGDPRTQVQLCLEGYCTRTQCTSPEYQHDGDPRAALRVALLAIAAEKVPAPPPAGAQVDGRNRP